MRKLLVVLALALSVRADELAQLRADYAKNFLDAKAHLRLSKYLRDHGQPLTAFYISEAARRGYFEEVEFSRAFRAVFLGDHFENDAAAQKRASEAVAAAPKDAKKRAALADILLSREEYAKAERELRAAIAIEPDSWEYTSVLAEVVRREGRESEAEKLLTDWLAAHPQSLEALRDRIQSLAQEKPEEALALANEGVKVHADAQLHLQQAELLARAEERAGAAKAYERAAELDPESAYIAAWAGRFFLETAKDNERALRYYLQSYFLDPDFYDGEFVEGRIRELVGGHTESEDAEKNWSDESIAPLIALLAHDDPNERVAAMQVLSQHMRADDRRIAELLQHEDLRVRGMAAYIAGALQGEKIVPLMQTWLDDPAQLIRYDAISVLAMHGGEPGREILMKLRCSGKVKEPRLKVMLDMVAEQQ